MACESDSWRPWSLADVADYINGRPTKPSEVVLDGVPVIKIAELSRGITASTDRITEDSVSPKHWVKDGDLLFAWSGSVGIHLYRGPRAALNQHIFRVVAKNGIDQRFLRYLLIAQMRTFSSFVADKQTTMGHVTMADLRATQVDVPPMREQRAIATVLGSLDDKIDLTRRMSATLEATVRAIFKAWFVDFEAVPVEAERRERVSMVAEGRPLYARASKGAARDRAGPPSGWTTSELREQVEVERGLSYKGSGLASIGMPLLNLNSIYEGGGYKYEGIKHYIGEYADRHIARPGDVIVANTEQGHDRLLIGYSAVVPPSAGRECLFSHHLYRLRPKRDSHLTGRFISYLLNTTVTHDLVSGFANGTTVNMLPIDGVESARVVVPPRVAVGAFDRLAVFVEAKQELAISESRTLAALRDTLLPKLLSGEVRVKDVA